ncbi:VOC family protein [Alicyclobacillus herbarius]|uniref:VOC family protein n=1 Tax=Alicyclobacillus herbarius TaxID=122960 RepID=UPI00138B19EF|nr:VOC family protein [Alicyclobacillus herbarius]
MMDLRLELFVDDVQSSTQFYQDVLGFELGNNRSRQYTVVHQGNVHLGLTPISSLPEAHPLRRKYPKERLGIGVEIVFETDDFEKMYNMVLQSGYALIEPLTQRPWGAVDFRVTDPDGYYVRITSRDAVSEGIANQTRDNNL